MKGHQALTDEELRRLDPDSPSAFKNLVMSYQALREHHVEETTRLLIKNKLMRAELDRYLKEAPARC